ncbi:MAG: helix-turn-helix domain-containing protein [Bifidobacteriaceae bacterium]|jgi:excisionase family DNA binding protein|nr:helix-turn-helix domain-containing protein [Bifidobacteriaceae bacterium]
MIYRIEQRYLSTPEFAQYAGIGVRTVRDRIRDGSLKTRRLGRRLLIDRQEFDNTPYIDPIVRPITRRDGGAR